MPHQAPLYDLMLLLSTGASPEERAKVVADVESSISSGGGSIIHKADWGTRALTFQINHQGDADYHLLQFTGPTSILDTLNHSLRINDDVLRFRIIKAIPGATPPPAPGPAMTAGAPASPPPVAVAAEPDADE
jgi:small subunit ribosomal protein S6